jgi:hypothetical protein
MPPATANLLRTITPIDHRAAEPRIGGPCAPSRDIAPHALLDSRDDDALDLGLRAYRRRPGC